MKKLLSLIAAAAIAATAGISAAAADRENAEPDVIVDGSTIIFNDQCAKIVDDVTLVPARGVFEAMGNTVDWDEETRKVTVTSSTGVRIVVIEIDSDVMNVYTFTSLFSRDVEECELEVPAQIINDRTMIPLRAVSEAFDCDVQWDADEYAVKITTSEPLKLGQTGTTATEAPTADPSATADPNATAAPEETTAPQVTDKSALLTVSLSTDTEAASEGDEFYVYVEAANLPTDSYISALTATLKYDKEQVEYVEGSGTFLGDDGEPMDASLSVENTDYDGGTKLVFLTIDESTAHTADGRIYRMTFKKLTADAADIALSNNYDTERGYETSILCSTKSDSESKYKDVEYEGKTANIVTTPITVE